MRKRIVAIAALLGLSMLVTPGATPAFAYNPGGAQGETDAKIIAGGNFNAARATLTITNPYNDIAPDGAFTSHWLGIQQESVTNFGHLVQIGYNWNHQLTSFTLGFFYEFYCPSGPECHLPVDITSAVLSAWGETQAGVIGHQIFFQVFYHNSDSWGFDAIDSTAGKTFAHYYYDTPGSAAKFEGDTGIISTEKDPYNDLLNDGTETIKQPAVQFGGSNWYQFTNPVIRQSSGDMKDPDGDGNVLETASTVDSNLYAYHVWKLYT